MAVVALAGASVDKGQGGCWRGAGRVEPGAFASAWVQPSSLAALLAFAMGGTGERRGDGWAGKREREGKREEKRCGSRGRREVWLRGRREVWLRGEERGWVRG